MSAQQIRDAKERVFSILAKLKVSEQITQEQYDKAFSEVFYWDPNKYI